MEWSGDLIVVLPRSGRKHFHSLVLQARARPELMWMALPRLPILLPAASCNPIGQHRGRTNSHWVKNLWRLTKLGKEGSAEVKQFEVPYVVAVIYVCGGGHICSGGGHICMW